MTVTTAIAAVTRYMDLNYPCGCGVKGCCGNKYEAEEIVEIVHRHLEST